MTAFDFDLAAERSEIVMIARAHAVSRFFPPLPAEYGEIIVNALELAGELGADAEMTLPAELGAVPRAAHWSSARSEWIITAGALLSAVRLSHLVAVDD